MLPFHSFFILYDSITKSQGSFPPRATPRAAIKPLMFNVGSFDMVMKCSVHEKAWHVDFHIAIASLLSPPEPV